MTVVIGENIREICLRSRVKISGSANGNGLVYKQSRRPRGNGSVIHNSLSMERQKCLNVVINLKRKYRFR